VRFVPQVRVGLVDFAHTSKIEDGGIDDDYIYGLRTLINVLEEIEKEHSNDTGAEEELWITELRRSRRSVLVCIENRTSKTLVLVDNVLIGEHQVWAALPQKEIPPYSAVMFGTNGTNLFSGTNACVCYKFKEDSNEEREYRFMARWENSVGLFSRRVFEGFIAPEVPNLRVNVTERAGRVLYHLGGDCTEVTFTLSEVDETADLSSSTKTNPT
jgi:putative sterol carrier protein